MPTKTQTIFDLTEERMQNMSLSKSIVVILAGNTEDSGQKNVKIRDDYSFSFKIGARAKTKPILV